MVIQILIEKQPTEHFIAHSTTFVWINVLLQFRFYEPIGVLLIVLADIIKGISWFLLLLVVLLLDLLIYLLRKFWIKLCKYST
jgi:hypothetical protein